MSSLPPSSAPYSGPYADKLTIETPEQTDLEFNIAGVGSRFLALALDTLIQIVAIIVFVFGGAVIFRAMLPFESGATWAIALLWVALFLIFIGYFAIFEAIWNGQTPGKRIIRIRVIKDTGRPIAPSEAVARNLMRLVDQMPVFLYGVGIVSALISRQNKRLGDFVAGTIVVHEQELRDFRPLWQASANTSTVSYGAEKLTAEEFSLIETFLNRREALPPDVRFRMAEQIATSIKQKLSVPPAMMPTSEKLLEAVAAERRASAKYL
ncbi:MAG: RDD family protein [Candidatus Acidiferrales bacterium]